MKIFLESTDYDRREKIIARNKKYNIIDDDNWESFSDNTDIEHQEETTLIEHLLKLLKREK